MISYLEIELKTSALHFCAEGHRSRTHAPRYVRARSHTHIHTYAKWWWRERERKREFYRRKLVSKKGLMDSCDLLLCQKQLSTTYRSRNGCTDKDFDLSSLCFPRSLLFFIQFKFDPSFFCFSLLILKFLLFICFIFTRSLYHSIFILFLLSQLLSISFIFMASIFIHKLLHALISSFTHFFPKFIAYFELIILHRLFRSNIIYSLWVLISFSYTNHLSLFFFLFFSFRFFFSIPVFLHPNLFFSCIF